MLCEEKITFEGGASLSPVRAGAEKGPLGRKVAFRVA